MAPPKNQKARLPKSRPKGIGVETLFPIVFNNPSIGYVIMKLNGRIATSNATFNSMAGIKKAEASTKNLHEIIHPDDSQQAKIKFDQIVVGQSETELIRCRLMRSDGSMISTEIHASTVCNIEGKVLAIFCSVADVTQRDSALMALQKSEQSYRKIFESCIIGLFRVDSDLRLLSCNPAFAELLGYRSVEECFLASDNFIEQHTANDKHLEEMIAQIASDGEVKGFEAQLIDRNGCPINVAISARAKTGDDDKSIDYIEGIVEDITMRKHAEHDLKLAIKAAEEANEAKSSFLANMSHEIRTPMTAILGYIDLLREDFEHNTLDHKTRCEYMNMVHENGTHLLELINGILDLSKIEAGKLEYILSEFSVPDIVNETLGIFYAVARKKGVHLLCHFEGYDIPDRIVSDRHRLKQVLINLVGNALKFTTSGSVKISVANTVLPPDEDSETWSDMNCPREGIRLSITDTGVGIDPRRLKEIFRPFMQADGSTSREFGGTGLGLAIVRHIVEELGGTIEVESALGSGSSFIITLPITPAGYVVDGLVDSLPNERVKQRPTEMAAEDHAVEAESISSGSKNMELINHASQGDPTLIEHIDRPLDGTRVLLAEDGVDNQRLISKMLEIAGADTTIVDNGENAVKQAMNNEYDVVLMDMQMPVLDGYTATQRLRELFYNKPIVALTAHTMSGDEEKCLEAGCSAYLQKPIDRKKLIHCLYVLAKSDFVHAR